VPPSNPGRRDEIVAVAAKLFLEKGIKGTTMRAIGEACGMFGGSLYHHFSSKDEIIAEIVNTAHDHAALLFRRAAASPLDPAERVEALLKGCFENYLMYPEAAQLYFNHLAYFTSSAAFKDYRKAWRASNEIWIVAFEEAGRAGFIDDSLELRELSLLVREMVWAVARWMPFGEKADVSDRADRAVRLITEGFLQRPPASPRRRR